MLESEYVIVEPTDYEEEKGEVNLVLKGGGSLAIAYLGAFEAINERGLKPATVMGASAGAMFALYIS